MSYLQRLLDAAPAALSAIAPFGAATPGDAPPSPLVAQDQRLAVFPDFADPFSPLDAEPIESGGESAQPTPAREPSASSSTERPPRDAGNLKAHGEPARPLDPGERMPKAERSIPKETAPETDAPPAPPIETLREIRNEQTIRRVERETRRTVETGEAAATSRAPSLDGVWPIAESDFHAIEAREPDAPLPIPDRVAPVDDAAPSPLREQGGALERGPRPEAPGSPPEPLQPAAEARAQEPPLSKPEPATPAADLRASPLAVVDDAATSAEPKVAVEPQTTVEREIRTVERIVEREPAPTPPPMTAAEASIIGPISIGRIGPREARARWAG